MRSILGRCSNTTIDKQEETALVNFTFTVTIFLHDLSPFPVTKISYQLQYILKYSFTRKRKIFIRKETYLPLESTIHSRVVELGTISNEDHYFVKVESPAVGFVNLGNVTRSETNCLSELFFLHFPLVSAICFTYTSVIYVNRVTFKMQKGLKVDEQELLFL